MLNKKPTDQKFYDLTNRVIDNFANLGEWEKLKLVLGTNEQGRFLKITNDIKTEYALIKKDESFFENLYNAEVNGSNSSYTDYKIALFSMMYYLQRITKNDAEKVDLVIKLRQEKEINNVYLNKQ